MTDQIDIAAIRARLAAATPGPWEQWTGHLEVLARATDNTHASVRGDAVCEVEMYRCSDHDPDPDDTECGCDEEDCKTCRPVQHADAYLIAHAPADLAALCDEIARLRSEFDDARNVALGLTEDCAGLREILAGRAMPPTDAEIEVHAAVGGRWLYRTAGVAPYSQETMRRPFALAEACRLEGNVGRWWALDASGAPCAWPVVTKEVE